MSGPNRWIIRTSIVGPELKPKPYLLQWFLSQKGSVQGYVNQSWNGITSLEWARWCYRLIRQEVNLPDRILQPGIQPPLSKYELLKLVADIWNHPAAVQRVAAPAVIGRTLVPNVPSLPLVEQLRELKDWYVSSSVRLA